MIDTVALIDPDGSVVYASKAGAPMLRDEHGYTDAPPAAEQTEPVEPVEPDNPDPVEPVEPVEPDEPKVHDPAAPRGNASRDTWAAYAEQVGLQVADEDSREDIKAAVAALEQ